MDVLAGGKKMKAVEMPSRELAPSSECPRYLGLVATLLCLLLAASSVAFCVLLHVQTSELQERVRALETERGASGTPAGQGLPAEEGTLLPLLRQKVEEILQEKLSAGLVRTRLVREAPSECVCPPGPPGKRGRAGRRGDPGPAVSTLDSINASAKIRPVFVVFFNDECVSFNVGM
ncbi:collagen alpha-1(XXIII) chain-like [Latimeria chalumnae]|uniref:collagen alpha-1(XXIII) chain-like n=1 Tax=Latimeria chalumnae TaxID=7897 RepID=UPI00313F09E9